MTAEKRLVAWAVAAPLTVAPCSAFAPARSRARAPLRACEPLTEVSESVAEHVAEPVADSISRPLPDTPHPRRATAPAPPRRTPPPPPLPPTRAHVSPPSAASALLPPAVPGPPPLPVVGNALDVVDTPISDLMLRYARCFGPFLKFSIVADVMYLVSDPLALQYINVSNAKNYLDRWTPPGFGPLLYDGRLRGLVFSQGRYWMKHRKLVASVFSSRDFLQHFTRCTAEKASFLLDTIWNLPQQPRSQAMPVNIHQALRMLTLDIIGASVFATEFGAMRRGSHPIETSLSNILHGVLDVIKTPVPLWRVMRTPGRARIEQDLHTLQKIEVALLRERRAALQGVPSSEDDKKDLLARLLRKRDADPDVDFQDEDLMWDVHDVIFAGHETTASALAVTIWLVSGSPRVARAIDEELREVLGGREPTFFDLPNLKYLEMVFNEALRMYPPTALIGRIAKEADVVAGYPIPAGSNVLVSPYVMGRLEALWDNPLEFRPERFSPENSANRHPMTHTPFGAGPRVCLGTRMATMEAKIILATLFQRVTFERTTDELIVDYHSTVSFKKGMDLLVRKRA